MVRAYLDTSVYGDIDGKVFPGAEVDEFRDAIARGAVTVLPSLANVEELLGPWGSKREAAVRRLRLLRELAGWRQMLKPVDQLVSDAIHAYATGAPAPAPIMLRRERRVVASALDRIADGSSRLDRDVAAIIAEVRKRKASFHQSMTEALQKTRAELRLKTYTWEERRALTFEVYWTAAAPSWAEALADDIGAGEACRQRGLTGLLDARPVRLAVGANLSLIFAEIREGYQPEPNDGYDLWHAVQASAADVLVTRDRALGQHLARLPVDGFRVVTSLRELLALLPTPPEPAEPH